MPDDKKRFHLNDVYPSDGGMDSKPGGEWEQYGSVGEKEPMPGPYASMASDDGYHDVGPQSEFAQRHGLPAVSAKPEASGEIETAEPTKGEGATGVIDYPHAGPPQRTWTAGGGAGEE